MVFLNNRLPSLTRTGVGHVDAGYLSSNRVWSRRTRGRAGDGQVIHINKTRDNVSMLKNYDIAIVNKVKVFWCKVEMCDRSKVKRSTALNINFDGLGDASEMGHDE